MKESFSTRQESIGTSVSTLKMAKNSFVSDTDIQGNTKKLKPTLANRLYIILNLLH